jgi:ring-1,2-phenylacetyl-CoA epoxidase subunit PaaD
MVNTNVNIDFIWNLMQSIPDPEIPVISIVELGIVRDVKILDDFVEVTITPTYTGCPAMKTIEDDILTALNNIGIQKAEIKYVISPAWTTDWITDEAKEKLREYGIAPPHKTSADKNFLLGKERSIACPQCKSSNTKMINQFGSTACKALYRCNDCLEPFDYFKCI